MIETVTLDLIRFLVATASRRDISGLTTIHIVKYLYLCDYYNSKTEGKKITSWDWKFWNFGPWCSNSYTAVKEAMDKNFISSRVTQSRKDIDEANEFLVFYVGREELTDRAYDDLGRKVLPQIRTRIAIESAIAKYACRTNPLLHYVYNETEPMLEVSKGDYLDFKGLKWLENAKIEKKPIKKRTIKKAKVILEKIRNKEKPTYHPPRGEFDELYFKCINILNRQDELEIDDGFDAVASVADKIA
ncbi:MAG: DUF4065 domain-containing protein [Bacteriovoracales bacterium]|nr:DUF4065 domain-containing protein [Bacteriovoracales bacterium]